MTYRHTLAAGAFLLATANGALAAHDIDPAKVSASSVTLQDISKPGSAGKSFLAATIIQAPVARLCSLIQQYEKYPGFMPNTDKTVVSERGPGHAVIDVTLKLPMGKVKKYRLRMEPKIGADECRVAWKLLPWPGLTQEETIADTTGYWQLTPAGTAGGTLVKYVVYTDPGPVPFGLGWIVDSLSKDSIPQTLEALRKRAASQ